VSEPVRTPFGYHIIQLEERKAARLKPFDEVYPSFARRCATP
jgi:parvulin-like peptidyl-prolyl isomerase